MADLTRIDLDTLKVGDVVGVPKYISYGWSRNFRDPLVDKETIISITPKRTKFTTDKGEYTTNGDRSALRLVVYDEEAVRSTESARVFQNVQSLEYKFDSAMRASKFKIGDLTNEELREINDLMSKLYSKYIEEGK